MEQVENNTQPWFRMPIMWLVLGIPLSAVLVGGVMLTLSISSFDGLVDDDYYRKGLGINQRLDRLEASRSMGLKSTLELDGEAGVISAGLSANPGFQYPATTTIHLNHATRADRDLSGVLRLDADNRYRGNFSGLTQGKWYVSLETESWSLNGSLVWPDSPNASMELELSN